MCLQLHSKSWLSYFFISENTFETTSFTVLNKVLMLSNNSEPPPVVKYALIASQFLITKIVAPAIAVIAIPTGPVIAVNPAITKGKILIIPPKPNKTGPITVAIPPNAKIALFGRWT